MPVTPHSNYSSFRASTASDRFASRLVKPLPTIPFVYHRLTHAPTNPPSATGVEQSARLQHLTEAHCLVPASRYDSSLWETPSRVLLTIPQVHRNRLRPHSRRSDGPGSTPSDIRSCGVCSYSGILQWSCRVGWCFRGIDARRLGVSPSFSRGKHDDK